MTPVRVRIFYQTDPLGIIAGGIDTFIRGLIKWAPDDIRFSMVGMTTDPVARPAGRFSRCVLGQREFDFFPLFHFASAGRSRVPLSMRSAVATSRMRTVVTRDFDVFDFHRLEHALLFLRDRRPKNAFFHQDPEVLRSPQSDIRWKRLPMVYDTLESRVVSRLSSAWCVKESGVDTLRRRYPARPDRFRFVPTWVDAELFSPVTRARREVLRREWGDRLDIDPTALRIVTVGRLDTQKNPQLMLEAFARLVAQGRKLVLLVVGDGVLRTLLEQRVASLGIGPQVRFLGLRAPAEIADVLRSSDMYALSSAYEGMPIALLEAMGCGLPAATTDVGEVRRVVKPGVNGSIAREQSADAFTESVADVLDHLEIYAGSPAVDATRPYQPARVLAPVYENYRELGAQGQPSGYSVPLSLPAPPPALAVPRLAPPLASATIPLATRPAGSLPRGAAYPHRRREKVIGAPIDVLGAAQARETILGWAEEGQSRYVSFCNVFSAVTYAKDTRHARAIDKADLVLADGAPIAWMLRRKGHAGQPRIDATGTMWALCKEAQQRRIKIGLYGSTPETLRALRRVLGRAFPELQIGYWEPLPRKRPTPEEDAAMCHDIAQSGIGLLFLAVGAARQDRWMARHAGRIGTVMLGVGSAFDYHARLVPRAPEWMQTAGFEWLYRVAMEPRRLWRHYLFSNSVFVMRSATELAGAVRRTAPGTVVLPQRAAARRDAGHRSRPTGRNRLIDQQYMNELLAKVDAAMSRRSGRVIEFIASGEGEGTSTLASAYAQAAVFSLNRRVLLLGAQSESVDRPGVLEAIATNQSMERSIVRHAGGYWSGSLLGAGDDESGWALAGRNELWKVLRSGFDEIILDMPSSAKSRTGVMMAPRCDGVIVVLEAEKTRAPVVEALVASLQAVRANLLGTVLNKRQFYVPDALYRRL